MAYITRLIQVALGVIIILSFAVYQVKGQNQTNYILTQMNNDTEMNNQTSDRLISANNQLGFRIFSQILKSEPDHNTLISPISIAIALSMTYNGADGETKTAMAKTLNLQNLSLEAINQANLELKSLLDSLTPEVQLDIANSIWTKAGLPFHPDFLANNEDFYGAEVREVDFNNPQTVETVNNWVKENTQGKIEKILEELKPEDVMLLINAIYFKGKWQEEFKETLTKEQPFTLLDGTEKQHPIMFQSNVSYPYYENEIFQAVSLSYGEGRVSMYVFLPREEVGLSGFYEVLNAENWETWMLQFQDNELNLGLPQFKTEYEVTLNNTLQALGMEIAFNEQKADFSGMRPIPPVLYISDVKHKTFIEVNEEGTEAAASTQIGIAAMSARPEMIQMIVNRPFFFAIRDNDTGSILFMGATTNPQN